MLQKNPESVVTGKPNEKYFREERMIISANDRTTKVNTKITADLEKSCCHGVMD